MHAFAISKISFRSLLSFTLTPNGFRKYIRCDNELNRFMSVHSWVQLHDTVFFVVVPCSFRFKNVYSLCVSSFLNRICKRVLVVYECVCVCFCCFFSAVAVVDVTSVFFRVCVCIPSFYETMVIAINGLHHTSVSVHLSTVFHLHLLLTPISQNT